MPVKELTALLFVLALVFSGKMAARDVGIGEEYVAPINYPKFSMTGEHVVNRKYHGFGDSALRSDLDKRFDAALSFEAGLLKYLNGGGVFGTSLTSFDKPFHIRLGLFAKPFVPLSERFLVFSKLTSGLAVDVASSPTAAEFYGSLKCEDFQRVYKGQSYYGFPFGGFGSATLGFEFFPFSRFGIAFEFGIRATLLHTRRNMPLVRSAKEIAKAPSNFNFMFYEIPFLLTLHLLL